MSDFHKETWSALFDGEATELELRRTLATMSIDEYARWQRYQWMRDAMKQSLSQSNVQISVVAAVAQAIENEPQEQAQTQISSPVQPLPKTAILKPLIGFATAASLAFVAVLMVVQKEPASIAESGFVASGNVSVSQLPIVANAGLSTVSATVSSDALQRQMDLLRLQKQQDIQRIEYYLQQSSTANQSNNKPVMLLRETSKR